MTGFERRNDALDPATIVKGRERFGIVDRHVLRAAAVLEPRMLGADAGIIEPGRHRMRLEYLTVVVLQEVRAIAVQNTRASGGQRRRVLARFDTFAARFDTDELHICMLDVRMEDTDRIAPAAHAGNDVIGLPSGGFG